jgi:hypothetical protein
MRTHVGRTFRSAAPTVRSAVFLLAALTASLAGAQGRAAQGRGGTEIASAAEGETMAVDPIACWWRTDKPSVYVGQPLTVVLTCSVVDQPSITVMVDESGLDPSVIQLPPFEVLGGTHAADLHTAERRFFQYSYNIRLINETDFGRDIPLPSLALTYKVRTVAGGAASDTRDRGYELPFVMVHMQTLVPDAADDIRDGTLETFSDLDSRGFTASALVTTGGVFFVLAGAFVVLAGASVVRGRRGTVKAADRLVPDQRVLGGANRELAEVRRAREAGGWTDELVGRALAALRIAASYAVDRRASQRRATGSDGPGAIMLGSGLAGRTTVLVSGAATSRTLGRAIEIGGPAAARRHDILESLQRAIAGFSAQRYGRGGALDSAALDEALESGEGALARLRREYTPIARAIKALRFRQETEARS